MICPMRLVQNATNQNSQKSKIVVYPKTQKKENIFKKLFFFSKITTGEKNRKNLKPENMKKPEV